MAPTEFKDARNTLGLSLTDAAAIFGVSYDAVRRWETAPDKNRARAVPGPASQLMRVLVARPESVDILL